MTHELLSTTVISHSMDKQVHIILYRIRNHIYVWRNNHIENVCGSIVYKTLCTMSNNNMRLIHNYTFIMRSISSCIGDNSLFSIKLNSVTK